jgi:hypothetical protein
MATVRGAGPRRAVRRHGAEPIFGLGVDCVNTWFDPRSPPAWPTA